MACRQHQTLTFVAHQHTIHTQGYGVQQSHARAAELYEQASAGGSAYGPALASLGLLYASGLGVVRNYTKSVEYLGEASDQGVASAQFNLATVLRQGLGGVPVDKERGRKLLEKVRIVHLLARPSLRSQIAPYVCYPPSV